MTGVPAMRRKSPAACVAVLAAAMLALAGCGADRVEDLNNAAATSYIEPPLPAEATIAPSPTPTTTTSCINLTASLRPTPADASPQPPTPSLDAIRARGRLIVGLDTGSNLMSFRDPATGRLEGFDVDIAREIARDLLGDPRRSSTGS
ncbi:hypothetical protein GCM10020255_059520 [Rhodococcus baikonurensis]